MDYLLSTVGGGNFLQPDITGPGLNILAAYTEAHSITGLPGDDRMVRYNIISGTSMSCPHVAGATASLKAYHPSWTPAALHSALVTTGVFNHILLPDMLLHSIHPNILNSDVVLSASSVLIDSWASVD